MRRWLREHALSVATLSAFTIFWLLQSVFGWQVHNEELAQYGQHALSYLGYLHSGHFVEATFENWESEFLQMGGYVLLTAYLVQKGSSESKPVGQGDRPEDRAENATAESPRPVHVGGLALRVYRNSLSVALLMIFAGSFLGHLFGGVAAYNEEQMLQSGAPPISAWQFLGTSDFWFQSMQNWQSEFLAVAALILLSIVLRQHGSPESKPVTASHATTGA
ncbi:DUF6766 family protein [Micromonospora olivasterospora]|uniref:Transmembrane protein n=1 Tax=Micromonospora olivasterospora TaxID=1880 RepID=A0A562IH60_MICOL|nr:DUF6766 family protein [Micromonospora olivasterospora]TWH70083.1 hypothetical protein JD77_05104 [Micromonospora olivasterospora]